MGGATRTSKLLSKLRGPSGGEAATAREFVGRFFSMQDERPDRVEEVAIAALDPFLRNLLFTDGTVTRALGVQLLAPVAVSRLDQAEVPIPAEVTRHLETESEEVSIRRRVSIGAGPAAPPLLWAESYLVPGRLPPGFVGLLDGAPDGIGQSLQRVALESYRELLWFGIDARPDWAPGSPAPGETIIRRLYRIVSDRQAAILISESFVAERRGGVYRLAGLDGSGSRPAEGAA